MLPFRVRRWIQNPVVTVLAIAYLCWNASWQPHEQGFGERSWVGEQVARLLGRPSVTKESREDFFVAVPLPTGGWGTPNGMEKWVGVSARSLPGAVEVRRETGRQTWGVWSPILSDRTRLVLFSPSGRGASMPATHAERVAILKAIESTVPGTFHAERQDWFAEGGGVERTLVWSGVFNDASVLAAMGLMVISLAWVPRLWRKPKAGACPACGYQVGDAARCPECGAQTERAEVKPIRATR